MTVSRIPTRGTGTASITTIRAPRGGRAPVASTQGTLALDFGGVAIARQPDIRPAPALQHTLEAFARRFCAAVVEVIGGDRGPQQLLRCTTESVYEELRQRAAALAGTTGSDQRLRRLRAQIRSVHLSCPSASSAELSVHVRHGARSRAIAARLEHRDGRWICVALQFG
ncbi:Rv3235 family protein [Nocardioides terrisoli]|uniref:Rv3235 family protein n=1 Tax=Nocardioides terrisoli TaxID=3388267 RepID=UPI00287B6012|nr:Rv3235 family protein [Nocardioides marmorisolisilvae]